MPTPTLGIMNYGEQTPQRPKDSTITECGSTNRMIEGRRASVQTNQFALDLDTPRRSPSAPFFHVRAPTAAGGGRPCHLKRYRYSRPPLSERNDHIALHRRVRVTS